MRPRLMKKTEKQNNDIGISLSKSPTVHNDKEAHLSVPIRENS